LSAQACGGHICLASVSAAEVVLVIFLFTPHPPSTEVATLKSPLDPLLLAALECPGGGSLRSEGEWQYINNNIIILRVLCGHHLLQGVKSQHADPQ